ncbi:MAG: hypothetical protein JSU68_01460 [Phycisphaerales bacterium]|nr:MAG: hypothetical protein JSU68_01460 [Phycisphaerales bacterium]
MAEIKQVWVSDTDKAIHRLNKLLQKQKEQIAALRKGKREAAGFASTAGKLDGVFSSLATKAAGILSVAGAIRAVGSALAYADEKRRRAAQTAREGIAWRKELVQISQTPEDLARKMGLARYGAQFGVGINEAGPLVFGELSQAFTEAEIRQSFKYKRFIQENLAGVMEAIAGMRGAFPALRERSVDVLMSQLLATAQQSKVGVAKIAPPILAGAASAKMFESTFEEWGAAVATLTKVLGSEEASVAAARLQDIARRDKRFRGIGLEGLLAELGKMTTEEFEKVVGAQVRAERGGALLRDMPQLYATILGEVRRQAVIGATAEGKAGVAYRLAAQDEQIRGYELAARQRAMAEVAELEALAPKQFQRDAVVEWFRREQAAAGIEGGLPTWAIRKQKEWGLSPERMAEAAIRMAAPPEVLERRTLEGGVMRQPDFEAYMQRSLEDMRELNANLLEETRKQTALMGGAPGQEVFDKSVGLEDY